MINKFILADDDQDDSDLFNEALKGIDNSIEIVVANNGKELIAKLTSQSIDPEVIFLDINMPEMNGWECLELIKQQNDLKNIPVIMYSTSSASIYGKKAVKSGAMGFYEKPTNFLQLQDFLKNITQSSKQELKKTLKELQASKVHTIYTD